jgi:hypothetical protein
LRDIHRSSASAVVCAENVATSSVEDDGLYDLEFVCAFFGGNRPLHPATIYRGIEAGHYPRPVRPSGQLPACTYREEERARCQDQPL